MARNTGNHLFEATTGCFGVGTFFTEETSAHAQHKDFGPELFGDFILDQLCHVVKGCGYFAE
jgi:hypothetical protein